MMPALPKSIIIDRDNTKGGDTTGSMDTTLNRPPIILGVKRTAFQPTGMGIRNTESEPGTLT